MARPAEAPPEQGAIVLGHRRVYIVPSRLGLFFGAALLILLIGSINYALSLGFALTFLLAGMGIAGMVQTTRNLAQLSIRATRTEPVFAGEQARFRLALDNSAAFDRPEILARQTASGAQCRVDVGANAAAQAELSVPAERRGWQPSCSCHSRPRSRACCWQYPSSPRCSRATPFSVCRRGGAPRSPHRV